MNPCCNKRGDEKARYAKENVNTKVTRFQSAHVGVIKHHHQHRKPTKGLDVKVGISASHSLLFKQAFDGRQYPVNPCLGF